MNTSEKKITILDCTLRDGSYLIDYQFTAEDTYLICLGLVRAGFELIEIGHGTGLGSTDAGRGKAAATDAEYLQAAQSAVAGSAAKFGMFFIPGIGKQEDLKMAAEFEMGFVRIGTNVTEIDNARPYIEKAKELGMTVSSNLMKSYAVSLDDFIRLAKKADEYGADTITVVDSAGGMLPHDVRDYIVRLRDATDKHVGFHGHNNLQLAIANTLEAVKAGAAIVDSSLQGIGRSAGNAQTEVLAMVLEKLGYHTGVDTYKAMDMGERIIKPMMKKAQGVDDISLVSGIARFHSSFYQTICDAAKKHEVDPRRLIIEVSEIDRVNVSWELAELTAEKIKSDNSQTWQNNSSETFHVHVVDRKKSGGSVEQLRLIISEMVSRSKKSGKESVLSITISRAGQTTFPFIRQNDSFVIGNVEASSLQEASDFIVIADGQVDWILLDECCLPIGESCLETRVNKSKFAWYSEDRVLRLGICTLLSQQSVAGDVMIFSDTQNADVMKLFLKQQRIAVKTHRDAHRQLSHRMLEKLGAIVSFGSEYASVLTDQQVPHLSDRVGIYAARPSAFLTSFWEAALARGLAVCRVDTRAALSAEMNLVIETKKVLDMMGAAMWSDVPVVSGGMIGHRGAVVVDSIKSPTRVIGIADGRGGLLRPEEEVPYLVAREKIIERIMGHLYKK